MEQAAFQIQDSRDLALVGVTGLVASSFFCGSVSCARDRVQLYPGHAANRMLDPNGPRFDWAVCESELMSPAAPIRDEAHYRQMVAILKALLDDPACGTLCSRYRHVVRCRKQTISISFRIKLTSVIAMFDTLLTHCPASDTLYRDD
jgi:hypothetical protein